MNSLCSRPIAIVFALFVAVLLLAPASQAQVAQANTMSTIAGGGTIVNAANTQCPGLATGVKSVDAVGDGCLATSAFLMGSGADMRGGIVMDAFGTVYYAGAGGNIIQAINQSTGLVTGVAGLATSVCGSAVDAEGDGCIAATQTKITTPRGIGIDPYGNLVLPQYGANLVSMVCTNLSPLCVSANLGKMIPIAGCTTGTGVNGTAAAQQTTAGFVVPDGAPARALTGPCSTVTTGPDSASEVSAPRGGTGDRFGNVYYADTDQSRFRVVLGPLTSTFFTGNNPLYAALQVNPASTYTTPVQGDVYTIVNVAGESKTGPLTAAMTKGNFCVGSSGPVVLSTWGGGCPFYLSGFAAAPSSGTVAALTVDEAGDMIYTDSNGLLLNVFYVGGTQTGVGLAAQNKMIAVIEANNGGVVPVAGSIYTIGGGGATSPSAVPVLGTTVALDNQIMKVDMGLDGNVYIGDNARVDILDMNTGYIHSFSSAAGPTTAGAFCTGSSGPKSIDTIQSGCPIGKATFGPSTALGIAADGQGNVYIADGTNVVIRKVLAQGVAPQTLGTTQIQNIAVHIPETVTGTVSGATAVLTTTPDMTAGAVTCGSQNANDKSFDCTVPVTMTPSAPGLRSATLTVTVPFTPSGGSVANAVVNVALGGTVTGSALALDNAAASVPAVATTQVEGTIAGFTVTNGGSGYTSAPTVTVTGAQGPPDQFQATISGGAVTGVTDLDTGAQYITPMTVSFSGGGGSGAAATVQLNGSVFHNNLTLVSGGSGYASAPAVTFSGGGGSGASYTTTVTGGVVTGLTFVSAGSGYTTPPTISFTAPPAVAIAATTSTVFSGITPVGVAVDGAGNVYTMDTTSGSSAFRESINGTSYALPGTLPAAGFQLAVDQLGDVFAVGNGTSTITELAVTGAPASAGQPLTYTPKTISYTPISGTASPEAIAVDAAGNLYVADTQGPSSSSIYRITQNTGVALTQTTVATGLTDPISLAVDNSGNVYVADLVANAVFKYTPGAAPSSYVKTTVTLPSGTQAETVATDAAGNLYLQDNHTNSVIEVPVSGPATTVLTGIAQLPFGLAVDSKGNVYSVSSSVSSITVVSRNAASYNFGTNESTVYSATITDVGNQASTGTNLLTNVTNFTVTGGSSLPCTLVSNSFTAQTAGNACTFTAVLVGAGTGTINDVISYLPSASTTGSATLTGTLTGTAVATTTTISLPTPASPVFVSSGTEATFTVTVAAQSGSNPPNGVVTVTVDSTVTNPTLVGSGTNGVATVTISGLTAGPHTISATYNTSGSFSGSNSGTPTSFSIGQASYSTNWGLNSGTTTPIPASQAIGTSVLNATSSIAGGYVYSVTPSGGSATIVDASTYLTIGTYALSATFTPTDTVDFGNTTLNGGTITVSKNTTTAAIGTSLFVVAPTLVTGNYTSVDAAIAAMPTTGGSIYIAPGTYTGFVAVNYPNVALRGLGGDPTKVILTNEFGAFKAPFVGTQSLGNEGTTSDEGSATLLVIPTPTGTPVFTPTNFYAENFTVNNTWDTDPTNSSTTSETSANGTCATGQAANNNFALYNLQTLCGSQALAIFTSADQSVMNNIYANSLQDTVFSGGEVGFSGSGCSGSGICTASRQYWWKGKITGDVDYIFGDSAAVFDHDNIYTTFHGTTAGGTETIEAQSKHAQTGSAGDYLSGYVFNHSTFTSQATGMNSLEYGRPYGTYSTMVLLNSFVDQVAPVGWIEFSGDTNLPTSTYVEYNTSTLTDPATGSADINGVVYQGTGGNSGIGVIGTRETTSQDPGYSFATNTLKTQITAAQAAQFWPDNFLGNTVSGTALQSGSSATWNATNALAADVNAFVPTAAPVSVAAGSVITILMRPQTAGAGILPTGTYTLLDGSTTIASGNLDATGEAYFTTSALSTGVHNLTWTYGGDSNFTGATTASALAVTVTGTINTTTTLSVTNATTSTYGQALTGSVSVAANLGTGVPTGTVSFFVDSSSTASTTCALSAGTCTFSISGITGGGHTLTASFPSNTSYNSSSSSGMSITVNPANQTITFAGPSTPVNYGVSPITLSATASSALNVTFTLDASSTPGAGSLSGNVLTVLSVGNIVIDASQGGNGNYNAATPVQRTLVVSNGTTLNVTAASFSRVYGTANPPLTASYTGQQGTDTFTATASTLATAASPVVVGGYAITPAVVAIAPASLANYTVVLHNGTLTVAQAAASVTLTQTLPATTGVGTGVSTTFAATVTDASAGSTGTPTGSVQFLDGSNVLGTVPLTGSVATLTTTFSTATTHVITAVYLGDTNFASGAQNTLNEVVTTPGFTGVANPSSLTIARGSSGTSILTFTPVGNYQGTLTLACNGLPAFVSCQFTPSTIIFTGNNAVQTSTLQVFTLNASAQPGTSTSGLLWIPAGLLACIVAMRRKKLASGLRPLLMIAIAALALTAMTGCGSSATFATPTGTTVTTVTASAIGTGGSPNGSQSISLTITITQ